MAEWIEWSDLQAGHPAIAEGFSRELGFPELLRYYVHPDLDPSCPGRWTYAEEFAGDEAPVAFDAEHSLLYLAEYRWATHEGGPSLSEELVARIRDTPACPYSQHVDVARADLDALLGRVQELGRALSAMRRQIMEMKGAIVDED